MGNDHLLRDLHRFRLQFTADNTIALVREYLISNWDVPHRARMNDTAIGFLMTLQKEELGLSGRYKSLTSCEKQTCALDQASSLLILKRTAL